MDCLTFTSETRRVPTRIGTLVVHDSGGPGRPLLLWPALFTDHTLYDAVGRRLGPHWRTLVVEPPGFGDSDPLPAGTGALGAAAGIPDLLDGLGIDRVVVAGTAWGGQIAAAFAAAHPERVDGLLMMSTPLGVGFGNHFLALALARLKSNRTFYADGLARALLGETTRRTAPQRVLEFTRRFDRFDPQRAAEAAETVIGQLPAMSGLLSRLACPTTLLFGDEDPACPAAMRATWSEQLPGAPVRVVRECGALAPLEAPTAVVEALATIG